MAPCYEIRDSAAGRGWKAVYLRSTSGDGILQVILVGLLPPGGLDALTDTLIRYRGKPQRRAAPEPGGPLAGLPAGVYLVDWDGTSTDITDHGDGCCCKNCPWRGDHGGDERG
jgi:hypothetical protein